MSSNAPASPPIAEHGRSERKRADASPARRTGLLAGGADGNERLTVLTGALLVVLTAVMGVTIVRIGQLMWLHLFVGLMLLGPVTLKLASTGYRFVRYYTHDPVYRRKGPPYPVLRGLAPLVVLATLCLFGTGVALLFAGRHTVLPLGMLHKVSFIVWLVLVAIHVLGHLPELRRALPGSRLTRQQLAMATGQPGSRRPGRATAGGSGRTAALAVALSAGLVLAIALIGQFSIWTH